MSNGRQYHSPTPKFQPLSEIMKTNVQQLTSTSKRLTNQNRSSTPGNNSLAPKQLFQKVLPPIKHEKAPPFKIFPCEEEIKSNTNQKTNKKSRYISNLGKLRRVSIETNNFADVINLSSDVMEDKMTDSPQTKNLSSLSLSNRQTHVSFHQTTNRISDKDFNKEINISQNVLGEKQQKKKVDLLPIFEGSFTSTQMQLQENNIEKISQVGKNIVKERERYFSQLRNKHLFPFFNFVQKDFEPQLPTLSTSDQATSNSLMDCQKSTSNHRNQSPYFSQMQSIQSSQQKIKLNKVRNSPNHSLSSRVSHSQYQNDSFLNDNRSYLGSKYDVKSQQGSKKDGQSLKSSKYEVQSLDFQEYPEIKKNQNTRYNDSILNSRRIHRIHYSADIGKDIDESSNLYQKTKNRILKNKNNSFLSSNSQQWQKQSSIHSDVSNSIQRRQSNFNSMNNNRNTKNQLQYLVNENEYSNHGEMLTTNQQNNGNNALQDYLSNYNNEQDYETIDEDSRERPIYKNNHQNSLQNYLHLKRLRKQKNENQMNLADGNISQTRQIKFKQANKYKKSRKNRKKGRKRRRKRNNAIKKLKKQTKHQYNKNKNAFSKQLKTKLRLIKNKLVSAYRVSVSKMGY